VRQRAQAFDGFRLARPALLLRRAATRARERQEQRPRDGDDGDDGYENDLIPAINFFQNFYVPPRDSLLALMRMLET
jgi:hypothetical protein